MIKSVYGLNIAVKDLDTAALKYERMLGVKPVKILGEEDFAFPGLKGVVFDVGGVLIHLIASLTDNTAIAKFLNSKGEGVFLVSLRSDNVQEDMERMTEAGAVFVLDQPAAGKFGTANFIHPKSAYGVQIEVYDPEIR
ncbi:MAG: VOC family protein [Desulfitobacteriaceae bacterium]